MINKWVLVCFPQKIDVFLVNIFFGRHYLNAMNGLIWIKLPGQRPYAYPSWDHDTMPLPLATILLYTDIVRSDGCVGAIKY